MARQVISGIPVSAGIAIGKAFFVNRSLRGRLPRQTVASALIGEEIERLERAFVEAETELMAIRDRIPDELQEHKHIINSHVMILKDPKILGSAKKYVNEHQLNAEWALEKAVADLEKAFSALHDTYIRERMQDVQAVVERVQSRLLGEQRDASAIEGRVIIMAHDLTPADTVVLDVNKIIAFVVAMGGKTSHTGIMARTMGIPAMVGVSELEAEVSDGDLVIIDGFKGKVIIAPDDEELATYHELQVRFDVYQRSVVKECLLPGETSDGYRVKVLANIELFEEVAVVIDNGGEGVGLYRTEYSYISRTELPNEEELVEEYTDMASILSPRRVVIRTLDLGADKFMAHFGKLEEGNPAMGLRAIRFCLTHPELFKIQLRAILRASVVGNISLMFPMISGMREVVAAKALLDEARTELRNAGIPYDPDMPIGIMIELPSAVMVAEFLAKEVDFFSIGTNDLIQYSLGIDRTNHHVSYLYQPLHPAVLRMIKQVVDAAHQEGIEVSLCGEVASDPYCVPILMGMQIDCLSMSPKAIPGIKRVIRQTSMEECKSLLRQVLECNTVSKINKLVKQTIFQRYPEELTFVTSLLDIDEGVPEHPLRPAS